MQHSLDWIGTRTASETFVCPACHAAVGDTCRNLNSGRTLLEQPAHYQRIALTIEATR